MTDIGNITFRTIVRNIITIRSNKNAADADHFGGYGV